MSTTREAALERAFQRQVKKELEAMFEDADIFKPNLHQGSPDLLLLIGDRWAMLECKRKAPRHASDYEPNQEWYIDYYNAKSFAMMICPENKEEVYYALQQAFRPTR